MEVFAMPVMDLDSIGGMPPGSLIVLSNADLADRVEGLLPDLPPEAHPVLKEVVLRLREAGD
ncbi:hypothetical protein AO718_16990 [Aeromonas veronii]|nr:hypothetical protein AO718_16990 [Aeromonas veronii]TNH80973.1 hypothetical protein CF140_14895 [Aeromonas sobria]KRV98454.1 hypothetical protein AO725_20020 [Aeromonas veronii]KRW08762.1 hypothetical protein AO745_20010 [Aeromonas veronii]KRW10847.1 hypothetical protein AO732_20330 [Aeromonas veronii]